MKLNILNIAMFTVFIVASYNLDPQRIDFRIMNTYIFSFIDRYTEKEVAKIFI